MRAGLLAGLTLALGLLGSSAWAQAVSDTERAKRDAEKVFSFIKFHAVKRAATPAAAAPRPAAAKPANESVAKAADEAGDKPAVASLPSPEVRRLVSAEMASPRVDSAVVALPAALPAAPILSSAAPLSGAEALPDPAASVPPPADTEEAPDIKLLDFVAPQLSPALLATLGATNPRVGLRFSIEPDGRVSRADAKPGVPRRLAVVAERALLQWRFEPLPTAQEVEVELVFQRD